MTSDPTELFDEQPPTPGFDIVDSLHITSQRRALGRGPKVALGLVAAIVVVGAGAALVLGGEDAPPDASKPSSDSDAPCEVYRSVTVPDDLLKRAAASDDSTVASLRKASADLSVLASSADDDNLSRGLLTTAIAYGEVATAVEQDGDKQRLTDALDTLRHQAAFMDGECS